MSEKPILFSTPMVQAILDGRKTQTRRTIKPQPYILTDQAHFNYKDRNYITRQNLIDQAPYGKPGDLLWVRETFAHTKQMNINPEDENYGIVFKQDQPEWDEIEGWKWKPSIFMPKDVCRIWLRVKEVRVERLCDISELEAISEGVDSYIQAPVNSFSNAVTSYHVYPNKVKTQFGKVTAKQSFKSLWTSINGQDSWQQNPWVWVVVFEVVSTTGKEAFHG